VSDKMDKIIKRMRTRLDRCPPEVMKDDQLWFGLHLLVDDLIDEKAVRDAYQLLADRGRIGEGGELVDDSDDDHPLRRLDRCWPEKTP